MIIFARGERIRHITLRPRLATCLTFLFVAVSVCHLGAATYLILRDDILSALSAPRIYAYEDRVAALRSQVDRIGTESLLQQRDVRQKVGELLVKQDLLAQRQERLEPLMSRTATPPPAAVNKNLPIPTPRPAQRQAAIRTSDALATEAIGRAAYAPESKVEIPWPLRSSTPDMMQEIEPNRISPDEHSSLEQSLLEVERKQLAQIETLTTQVYVTTEAIEEVLDLAGFTQKGVSNTGGPLVEMSEYSGFEERMQELDEALGRLDELKGVVRRVPIINPLPGAKITSRFGSRKDPILKRVAYHSGLDFRAKRGDLIRATGAGKVIKAGWYGGYGRMVEIDHGSGITTRYAHLHEILVTVGDRIATAGAVARAGSSGRSTGPHLHYEIRRNGEALNPLKFISAGRQIAKLL